MGPLPVRWAIRLLYCDVIRGIPVLVLIFTIYYGLPLLIGFEINSFRHGGCRPHGVHGGAGH